MISSKLGLMASQEAEPGDAGKPKVPPACHTEPVRNTLFFLSW